MTLSLTETSINPRLIFNEQIDTNNRIPKANDELTLSSTRSTITVAHPPPYIQTNIVPTTMKVISSRTHTHREKGMIVRAISSNSVKTDRGKHQLRLALTSSKEKKQQRVIHISKQHKRTAQAYRKELKRIEHSTTTTFTSSSSDLIKHIPNKNSSTTTYTATQGAISNHENLFTFEIPLPSTSPQPTMNYYSVGQEFLDSNCPQQPKYESHNSSLQGSQAPSPSTSTIDDQTEERDRILAGISCPKERRKVKNRYAARKTRLKKTEKTDSLEVENKKLKDQLQSLISHAELQAGKIEALEYSIKIHSTKCPLPDCKKDFPQVFNSKEPPLPPRPYPPFNVPAPPPPPSNHYPPATYHTMPPPIHVPYNEQYQPTAPSTQWDQQPQNTPHPPTPNPPIPPKRCKLTKQPSIKNKPTALNLVPISNKMNKQPNIPPPRRSPRLKIKKEDPDCDNVPVVVRNKFNLINYDDSPKSARTKRSMDLLEILPPQSANTKKAFDLVKALEDSELFPTPTIKAQVDSPAGRTRSKTFHFDTHNEIN